MTCARAEYRLGAVSVLRKRREARDETRRDCRSMGVKVRDAIVEVLCAIEVWLGTEWDYVVSTLLKTSLSAMVWAGDGVHDVFQPSKSKC
jgi:hypothetical protein